MTVVYLTVIYPRLSHMPLILLRTQSQEKPLRQIAPADGVGFTVGLLQMSAAPAPGPFKASAKAAAEEGERIHRIRITLSSRNVKNLEKGAWFDHTDVIRSNDSRRSVWPESWQSWWVWCSVRGPDPWCQGQAAEGEGPRAHAHQASAHHDPQVAVR
jgi:hypothetical protein